MLLRHLSLGLICAGLLAPLACSTTPSDDELVAKVNGKGITKVEFDTMVERNMARYRGQGHALPPGIEGRIKESVLRRMVDDMVILQKAEEIGATVSAEELTQKFQEHKDRFRTEQAFQDYLKRSNNTAEAMKEDLERNMLRDRVVEKMSGAIDVTDADVAKYYEENKQRFIEKEQIKAARIMIKAEVAPGAKDADVKAAEKKAEGLAKEVYTKASSNGTDFGGLAAQFSVGPEKARKGDLGWLTRGRMPPEFDAVAFAMEPNTVSKPTKIKDAWEIIQVTEKRPERQRTLDQVQENIKNSLLARLRNEKRRDVLRDLKKDAKVEHLIKFEPEAAGRPGAPVGMPGGPGGPGGPGDFRAPREPRPMLPEGHPDMRPGMPGEEGDMGDEPGAGMEPGPGAGAPPDEAAAPAPAPAPAPAKQ